MLNFSKCQLIEDVADEAGFYLAISQTLKSGFLVPWFQYCIVYILLFDFEIEVYLFAISRN